MYEPLEIVIFWPSRPLLVVTLKDSETLDYLQIDIFKFKPQRKIDVGIPTICGLSKHNTSQIIHKHFVRVSIVI